ncbi:MAG: protein kinase [Chloroflexi bacterium]|nr:protein kinase [Chloroflexota bacterium]
MTMIGKTLDCYKLLEEIGSGGFATVYLGLDTRVNEPVAVKVLLESFDRDTKAVERLEREAQALMKLPAHPNIIGLRGSGKVDGYHYLVMDYVAGKDLSTVLDERRKLPIVEAVEVAIQVARALSTAAIAGIVHRDVKPENIRLLPDGTVKVMDFGIARDTSSPRITQVGLLAGTTKYVAPEIWKGKSPDKYSDIYALGCVLYEMLVGSPPFVGATPESIMRAHLQVSPDLDKLAKVGVPAGLCDLIDVMLSKEPTGRPTADELVRDLPQYGRPGKRVSSGLLHRYEDQDDDTRINLKAVERKRPRLRWLIVPATLLLGLAFGAVLMATLGLPLAIDSRAAQFDPTRAAAVRHVADLLRGTPFSPSNATAFSVTAVITPGISSAPEVSPTITSLPVSIYTRLPGRLRTLPDGRKVNWFIDNEMIGVNFDPPLDSELGQKYWTKLDYSDEADYGAGYVTAQAGESVSATWSMDVALAAGFYEVFVYRPSYARDFVAESVQYGVYLGSTALQPFDGTSYVNQQSTRGTWVSIGGYEIDRPDILSVHLDVEGARPIAYEVDVDAIGIVRLDGKKLVSR